MKQHWLFNSGINILGAILPIALAIFSIPLLLENLGMERFGLLSLSWVMVSYLGLLDFGLSRALSQQTAENINNKPIVTQWFLDTHLIIIILSTIGSVLLLLGSSAIEQWLINTDNHLKQDVSVLLWFTALLIVPSLLINSMSYFLIALNEFISLNLLKTPFNISNIAIPTILIYSSSYKNNELLASTLFYMLIVRWLFVILFLMVCIKKYPHLLKINNWRFQWHKKLFQLGGWMTISNIIGPIMTYFDRFFIAALLTPYAIGIYTIAYEISSKLMIISGALSSALSPHFASLTQKKISASSTIVKAINITTLIFIPILIISYYYTETMLQWWLNQASVSDIAEIINWLILGIFFNTIALIGYTHLHFSGRPDVTAKLHLIELPIYLILLSILLIHIGVVGAAIAWVIRAGLDMLLMLFESNRINNLLIKNDTHNKHQLLTKSSY